MFLNWSVGAGNLSLGDGRLDGKGLFALRADRDDAQAGAGQLTQGLEVTLGGEGQLLELADVAGRFLPADEFAINRPAVQKFVGIVRRKSDPFAATFIGDAKSGFP